MANIFKKCGKNKFKKLGFHSYKACVKAGGDFPSDDEEKLASEHIKEAKRGKAKITNMGWGSGSDFIESKTDKGILYSDIEGGKVSHEWEYDEEDYE